MMAPLLIVTVLLFACPIYCLEESKQESSAQKQSIILRRYYKCTEKDHASREDFIKFANKQQPFPIHYAYCITMPAIQGQEDRHRYRAFTLKKVEPCAENPLTIRLSAPKKGKSRFKQLKRDFGVQPNRLYCTQSELNCIRQITQSFKSDSIEDIHNAVLLIENLLFPAIINPTRPSRMIAKDVLLRRGTEIYQAVTQISEEIPLPDEDFYDSSTHAFAAHLPARFLEQGYCSQLSLKI